MESCPLLVYSCAFHPSFLRALITCSHFRSRDARRALAWTTGFQLTSTRAQYYNQHFHTDGLLGVIWVLGLKILTLRWLQPSSKRKNSLNFSLSLGHTTTHVLPDMYCVY